MQSGVTHGFSNKCIANFKTKKKKNKNIYSASFDHFIQIVTHLKKKRTNQITFTLIVNKIICNHLFNQPKCENYYINVIVTTSTGQDKTTKEEQIQYTS